MFTQNDRWDPDEISSSSITSLLNQPCTLKFFPNDRWYSDDDSSPMIPSLINQPCFLKFFSSDRWYPCSPNLPIDDSAENRLSLTKYSLDDRWYPDDVLPSEWFYKHHGKDNPSMFGSSILYFFNAHNHVPNFSKIERNIVYTLLSWLFPRWEV